jgi:hypothetical protein
MPVSYHIDSIASCVIVRLEGVVTDNEVLTAQRQMYADPAFNGSYARLIDTTAVTQLDVSAATATDVAVKAVRRGMKKAALVANDSELVKAVTGMYQLYASPPARIIVKDNMKEALEWLRQSQS